MISGSHDVTGETTATETSQSGAITEAQHTDYVYDDQHRVTSRTTYRDYDPATGQGTQPTTTLYAYDSCGNVTDEQVFDGTETGTRISWTQNTYDAGRLTSEKHWVSGSTWTETQYSNFAANGEPQTTIAKDVQLSYGGAAQDLTQTATYDAFGNLLTARPTGAGARRRRAPTTSPATLLTTHRRRRRRHATPPTTCSATQPETWTDGVRARA